MLNEYCYFEQATLIKSIKTEYLNTEIDGCFYHFSKNVYKKICDLGLYQISEIML